MTAPTISTDRASERKSVCVTVPIKVTHCVLQPKLSDLSVMNFTNLSGYECQNVPLICNVSYCSLGFFLSWERGHTDPAVLSEPSNPKIVIGNHCSQSVMKNRCLGGNCGLFFSVIWKLTVHF